MKYNNQMDSLGGAISRIWNFHGVCRTIQPKKHQVILKPPDFFKALNIINLLED